MSKLPFETLIENKAANRSRREEKALSILEKREIAAERMIGELSSGKTYIFPVGGKYREGTRSALISFLIRNQYV